MSQNVLRLMRACVGALFGCLLALAAQHASAAVTIASFQAQWQAAQVKVTWTTGSETNNAGFNLFRSATRDGAYAKLNANLIPSQCVGCINGASYTYMDSTAAVGQSYFYKLQAVDYSNGTQEYGQIASAPAPAATPTSTASSTPTSAPSPTASVTSTPSRTPTSTPSATPLPSATPSPVLSNTATRTPTRLVLPSPTPTMPAPTATIFAAQTPTSVAAVPPTATFTSAPVAEAVQPRTPAAPARAQPQPREATDSNAAPWRSLLLALIGVGALGAVALLIVLGWAYWRTRQTR